MLPNIPQDTISKLRFFTYATVAANKELSSDLIEAIPHEQSSFLEGELNDHITEQEGIGKDKDDQSFKSKIKTTASIKAKWLSLTSTNRLTSPDVRRGEEVIIYKYGDTDQYWWTTLHQDQTLRRLETVIYGYSNNSKENIKNDHDSMYWLEISTHRKVVRFHTAKNDGEPFTYDIQIDTKKGNFTLEDDNGNYIFLDSKAKQIKARNNLNSYIDIDKKNITLHSLERVDIITNHFSVKARTSIDTKTRYHTGTSQYYTVKDHYYTHQTHQYYVSSNRWYTQTPTANFSRNIRFGSRIYGPLYFGHIDFVRHPW